MNFTTGSKELDRIFGGYEPGVITELFGEAQSCKTTLACYVPIGRIYLYWKTVKLEAIKQGAFYVVDGDGGFDFERAQQIWRGMGCTEDDIELMQGRIRYFQPTTFAEQHTAILETIPAMVEPTAVDKKAGKKGAVPLCLSADPLIAIYRDKMLTTPGRFKMVATGEYTGKLGLELNRLRHLAVKYHCPCIVTSWPGSPVRMGKVVKDPEQPMIGGRAFGFMGKIIIELQIPVVHMPMRKAILIKHRSKPAGLEATFRLSGDGIEDVELPAPVVAGS